MVPTSYLLPLLTFIEPELFGEQESDKVEYTGKLGSVGSEGLDGSYLKCAINVTFFDGIVYVNEEDVETSSPFSSQPENTKLEFVYAHIAISGIFSKIGQMNREKLFPITIVFITICLECIKRLLPIINIITIQITPTIRTALLRKGPIYML